jgi:hypothetical protein
MFLPSGSAESCKTRQGVTVVQTLYMYGLVSFDTTILSYILPDSIYSESEGRQNDEADTETACIRPH